jgi:hypothetical protein
MFGKAVAAQDNAKMIGPVRTSPQLFVMALHIQNLHTFDVKKTPVG